MKPFIGGDPDARAPTALVPKTSNLAPNPQRKPIWVLGGIALNVTRNPDSG